MAPRPHADRACRPRQRGFDYPYGPLLSEIDDFTHSAYGTRDWFRDNEPVVEKRHPRRLPERQRRPRSARYPAEIDMSKNTIPSDNGPWRDGKGMLYEGGTGVAGLVKWPGRVKAAIVVDEPLYVVGVYPTLARLAGASTAKRKPLEGVEAWKTISEGAPSPRTEVVHDVERFRATLRQGEWTLVWQATLPSRTELYDSKTDPSESKDVAAAHPEKVVAP